MPSGSKMPGAEELVERHAGDHFHQAAEHVDGQAVLETLARFEQQRLRGQGLDAIADGAVVGEQAVGDARLGVAGAEGVVPMVGEAGGVGEQLLDGDVVSGGDGVGRAGGRFYQNLLVLELGQVFRDGGRGAGSGPLRRASSRPGW